MPETIYMQYIYKYLCVATEVPLAEISFWISAAPVIIRGSISFPDLDSLVTTAHPEIIPCSDQFQMVLETTKDVWVTINGRVSQIAETLIHEKVSKIVDDQNTTLMSSNCGRIIIVFPAIYNPPTRKSWTHSVSWKNVLAVHQLCWEMSSIWTTCSVMYTNQGSELLNNLNPLGFVSREFSLIKEFILISLAIEYLTILVSCAMAVLMFDLMPTIAALINRINAGPGQAPEPEGACSGGSEASSTTGKWRGFMIEVRDKLTLLFNHSSPLLPPIFNKYWLNMIFCEPAVHCTLLNI